MNVHHDIADARHATCLMQFAVMAEPWHPHFLSNLIHATALRLAVEEHAFKLGLNFAPWFVPAWAVTDPEITPA